MRYTKGKRKGEIHSHLQPTAALEAAQQIDFKLDGIEKGPRVIQSNVGDLSSRLNAIHVMSELNIAVGVADVGVSVAGFALMNAKLNAVQSATSDISREIEFIQ